MFNDSGAKDANLGKKRGDGCSQEEVVKVKNVKNCACCRHLQAARYKSFMCQKMSGKGTLRTCQMMATCSLVGMTLRAVLEFA